MKGRYGRRIDRVIKLHVAMMLSERCWDQMKLFVPATETEDGRDTMPFLKMYDGELRSRM